MLDVKVDGEVYEVDVRLWEGGSLNIGCLALLWLWFILFILIND